MRFVAKQPKEGINVSDTHPLVEASTLLVGLTAIFVAIAIVLVFIVEIALHFVSAEDEARFFSDWLPDDLITVSPNDERLFETQHLVDRLSAHWPESPYELRVEIDASDQANAMALPGGLIVVTQGLLDQVESENELAFVLGHELGHFKNRDHLRGLGRGAILSLFFAVTMGGDAGGVGVKIADLTLRGFSRNQESDADAFGLSLVNAEYSHVDEAWRLFERWRIADESIGNFLRYLSTHPGADDRVSELEAQALREGWSLDGEITPLNL